MSYSARSGRRRLRAACQLRLQILASLYDQVYLERRRLRIVGLFVDSFFPFEMR